MPSHSQELASPSPARSGLLPWTQPVASGGPRVAAGEASRGCKKQDKSAGSSRLGPGLGMGQQRDAAHWQQPQRREPRAFLGWTELEEAAAGGLGRGPAAAASPLPVLRLLIPTLSAVRVGPWQEVYPLPEYPTLKGCLGHEGGVSISGLSGCNVLTLSLGAVLHFHAREPWARQPAGQPRCQTQLFLLLTWDQFKLRSLGFNWPALPWVPWGGLITFAEVY